MSKRPGLTVGSLRGVPMGSARPPALVTRAPMSASEGAEPTTDPRPAMPRARVSLSLAPTRRRGCCGTGCVGCPYGDWLRRVRALGASQP